MLIAIILPNQTLITEPGKSEDLIWLSELGRVNPVRGYPDIRPRLAVVCP